LEKPSPVLKRLRSIFVKSNSLIGVRQSRGQSGFRAESFADSEVQFLWLHPTLTAGIDIGEPQDRALKQIRLTIDGVKMGDAFSPFIYVREGRRLMPLFSRDDLAQHFVQQYARQMRKIFTFQVFAARGFTLIPTFEDCDAVILNDGSQDEYQLSDQDIAQLKKL
jgi:hypothetical protein